MAKYFELTSLSDDGFSLKHLIQELNSLGCEVFSTKNEYKIVELLTRVYRNRKFLTDYLIAQIHHTKMFKSGNPYTAQVFMLHTGAKYSIRASIWEPANKSNDEMFFYDVPHDHNFTFYTLGYYGSGYKTKIAQYHTSSPFKSGDKVELVNEQIVQLKEGKVMLYEKGKDVHSQIPPDELSISINIADTAQMLDDQYYFDFSSNRVTGYFPKESDILKKLQADFLVA
ncbi:hypothetical protein [Pseudoalteromonas nigrifaciens]|uniref:hypothetical protein n=1 Tax=Pseudoalteromonas nigrifaciens TaxID=28109 RepID=UPI003CFCC696